MKNNFILFTVITVVGISATTSAQQKASPIKPEICLSVGEAYLRKTVTFNKYGWKNWLAGVCAREDGKRELPFLAKRTEVQKKLSTSNDGANLLARIDNELRVQSIQRKSWEAEFDQCQARKRPLLYCVDLENSIPEVASKYLKNLDFLESSMQASVSAGEVDGSIGNRVLRALGKVKIDMRKYENF